MEVTFFFSSDSLFLHLCQALFLLSGLKGALSEYYGDHLPYSKFSNSSSISKNHIPSRKGMFFLYCPSLLLSSASLFLLTSSKPYNSRFLVLASALTLHFLKRVLEVSFLHQIPFFFASLPFLYGMVNAWKVLFLHVYSGTMDKHWTVAASITYMAFSGAILYAQKATHLQHPPSLNLMPLGIPLFLIGLAGNLYHHYLLAALRKKKSHEVSKYCIPQGGLFSWLVCPHYLFELVGFIGVALIAQTLTAMSVVFTMALILTFRSRATKAWYLQKIENFPPNRYALIPFVF